MGNFLPWVGAATGLYTAISGKKSADRAYNQTQSVLKPSAELQSWASPYLRSIIERKFAPQAELSAFPDVEAGHARNLEDIDKQRDYQLGQSRLHWARAGNISRARGEEFDAAQAARDARAAENYNYLTSTEARKEAARNALLQAVANAMGLGQASISPSVTAGYQNAQLANEATQTGLLGLNSVIAAVYEAERQRELERLLGRA